MGTVTMESLRLIFDTRMAGFGFDDPPLMTTGEPPTLTKQSGSESAEHKFGGLPFAVV